MLRYWSKNLRLWVNKLKSSIFNGIMFALLLKGLELRSTLFSYTVYLDEDSNTVSLVEIDRKTSGMCLTVDIVRERVVYIDTNGIVNVDKVCTVVAEVMGLNSVVKDMLKRFLFNFAVRRTTKEDANE